jgi:GntR family transcriptional regulator / MocR family aminotransferase
MLLHTPSLEQITLGRFMEEGYLERHIHKMKKIYKKRRDHLLEAMEKHFSHQVKILGHSTGLHLVAEYQHTVFTENFVKKMRDNGIRVYPVEDHAIKKGKHQNQMILGYGHLCEEEIEEGVRRLAECLG